MATYVSSTWLPEARVNTNGISPYKISFEKDSLELELVETKQLRIRSHAMSCKIIIKQKLKIRIFFGFVLSNLLLLGPRQIDLNIYQKIK